MPIPKPWTLFSSVEHKISLNCFGHIMKVSGLNTIRPPMSFNVWTKKQKQKKCISVFTKERRPQKFGTTLECVNLKDLNYPFKMSMWDRYSKVPYSCNIDFLKHDIKHEISNYIQTQFKYKICSDRVPLFENVIFGGIINGQDEEVNEPC